MIRVRKTEYGNKKSWKKSCKSKNCKSECRRNQNGQKSLPVKCALLAAALLFATADFMQQPSAVAAADSGVLQEQMSLPQWRTGFSAGDDPAKLRSRHAGSRMTGRGKEIYEILADGIRDVAEGVKTSTQFQIPVKDLVDQLQYTQEELGASFATKEDQYLAMGRFIGSRIITDEELHEVYASLLADLPYELYWYDKAAEDSFIVSMEDAQIRNDSGKGPCLCVDQATLTFAFLVDGYYGSQYGTNAGRIAAAKRAAANAQKIVKEAEGLSDYQKLVYYRKKICTLTSYNMTAAQTRSPGNQNPWQLVYVFDEDSTTNVVCEGYAKAFQYLCDLTTFEDTDICSYIVSGTISGNHTDEGPHMWNVVHMGDQGNYLTDVTNCDQGMIGQEEQLFLTGCTYGNPADGYGIQLSSGQVFYRYEDTTKSIYSTEDLTLVQGPALKESDVHVHTWKEARGVDASCTVAGKRITVCSVCGKEKAEEIPATGHAYGLSAFWSEDSRTCTVALACKNDSSHRLVQRAEDTGLEHRDVTLEVTDADGTRRYTLKMDGKDLTVSNVLSVFRLDIETGTYRMADGQTVYTVKEDGSLLLSLNENENENYELLNAEEAAAVSQEILQTIAPQKPSITVRKGKSVRLAMDSGLDLENVKKIVYTSSAKKVAKVSANGKITGKKAGTAVVRAKVTLKNGMEKTVSVKVRVK